MWEREAKREREKAEESAAKYEKRIAEEEKRVVRAENVLRRNDAREWQKPQEEGLWQKNHSAKKRI